jgi:hypothetical protein
MARIVPVRESRVRSQRTSDGLRIDLARRRPWLMYVMPGWTLTIVALGAVGLIVSDPPPGEAAPVAFLVLWFGIGVSIVAISLWALLHREWLVVDPRCLTQVRRLGPIRRERRYARERIEYLRVSPDSMSIFDPRSGLRMWGVGAGSVAFDYGDRTYRIADVDEAEAKRVVAVLAEEGVADRTAP